MKYTAGWNSPGCLPEHDPYVFDTYEEAREFLFDELSICADHEYLSTQCDDWVLGDQFRSAAVEVRKQTVPFATSVGQTVYWIEAVQEVTFEDEVVELICTIRSFLKAFDNSTITETMIADLRNRVDAVECWVEEGDQDPRSMGWVDDRGRP